MHPQFHLLFSAVTLLIVSGAALAVVARRRLARLLASMAEGAGEWGAIVLRQARRAVILIVGGSVALVGVVLIFTPGPAMVVIPVGLSILAIEFAWARRWLKRLKDMAGDAVQQAKRLSKKQG